MKSDPTTEHLEPLGFAHPAVRTWFEAAFTDGPTNAQNKAWPAIASGASTLLLAPTGSGKTLAAFLVALNRLMFAPQPPAKERCRVLYISPLKALGVDVERNLRAPLSGIRATAQHLGTQVTLPEVGVRSGDTDARTRQRMLRNPPDILITTPESLYLMLTSSAKSILQYVETIIIDEIHTLVSTKRGVHLFLSLERLERLAQTPQRVGLSATQRPLDEVARLLGGGTFDGESWIPRPVTIVDAGRKKRLDLTIEVAVEDMAELAAEAASTEGMEDGVEASGLQYLGIDDETPSVPSGPAAQPPGQRSIWPSIHPRLVELIRDHTTTLIFVNSRRLAERLAAAINEVAEEEICLSHHGSLSKDARASIEDRLKRGQLPALVATSSLELGIDMGAIDLVLQIEAPPSVASGMQRIGRANHDVGGVSKGIVFPKFRGDLLSCAAVSARMFEGLVEETRYPRNPLDVLAQQIVAIVSEDDIHESDLLRLVRQAAPYAELPEASYRGVLDMLSGLYPSDEFSELKPRITWDRVEGSLSARSGAKRVAVVNAGTIPDRGLYGVFLAEGQASSKRVGELDEEMVFESRVGDVFLLGASSWRIEDITHDRVLVTPAPGEPGKMPFWHGDRPGRPAELGRSQGELTRRLVKMAPPEAEAQLCKDHALEPRAAKNLVRYLHAQLEVSLLPTDDRVVLERFTDEIGDWRVVILSPFGSRVHAPWATAVQARLRDEASYDVDVMWTDDGMVFRLLEADAPPAPEAFVPAPTDLEDLIARELGQTSLFAARFRENAGRSLLLPKRMPGKRTPLWAQRRRSSNLLSVAAKYSGFPIILETFRECLKDVFDLPALQLILQQIQSRKIKVEVVDTTSPSPFAASVLFSYVANFMYEGDAPLAERRAQALSVDQAQLRALLGEAEMRKLLDAEALDEVELSLQRLDSKYPIKDADRLHDLLIQLGPIDIEGLQLRSSADAPVSEWVAQLLARRRLIRVTMGGLPKLAAVEDSAKLRDGLGIVVPPGVPADFLEPVADALVQLVGRFARTHGPFTVSQCSTHFGLGPGPVRTALEQLERQGRVQRGEYLPQGQGEEWCDAEVLRRLKRMSLARLRAEVEPVDTEAFVRFSPNWHSLHRPSKGLDAILNAVEKLQGAPLPASDLDRLILPARVEGYRSQDLDELCSAGEIIWRGVESIGDKDGRIALFLTDDYARLSTPAVPVEGQLACRLREYLAERGAVFFSELASATGAFGADLVETLWDMVWAGELTNDTLRPMRARLGGSKPGAKRPRGRGFRSRRSTLPGTEGRWSLLPPTRTSTTERQTALALQLLERHGVLTREAAGSELSSGGFSSVYPVLKALEEAGKVRRGYFVEGLGAAQFAFPGAEDRLRSFRDPAPDEHEDPLILAATDPANPFGAALPWPEREQGRAARAAGARVVLYHGQLLGFLPRSESALLRYSVELPHADQILIGALTTQVDRGGLPFLQLAKIDQTAAEDHPLAHRFLEAGFRATAKGLLYRKPSSAAVRSPAKRQPQTASASLSDFDWSFED